MRRSIFSRPALILSTTALFGSLACQKEPPKVEAADYPGRMAEGYCTAVFSCQCDDYPYATANECFADQLALYDAVNDDAFLAGLLYDGTCPAKELSDIESLACKGSVPMVPEGICIPPCNVWYGQAQAGYPCQVLASSADLGIAWSNCGQNLTCQGGVCVNPCQGVMALPGVGQPCPQNVCAAGAMCDETMTCVAATPLPGPGQPCLDGVCNAYSVCNTTANTCAVLPTTGQPCVEYQCDANSMCDANNLCVARTPIACGLIGGGFPGDGDGDTGDGDGDTGDGDGDTGDGDGDTGDGDGDPGCETVALAPTVPTAWEGNTTGLTGTESGSCGGGNGPEEKLSYTAPQDGTYQMSLEGSDFDTIMYVRDGDCAGAELACDDDTIAPASQLQVTLTAGQQVTIFVDAYSSGGNYILSITLLSP